MAYIVQSDLEARYGVDRVAQVFADTDASGVSTGSVNATTLAAIIADASAEFEELIGTVYAVPLTIIDGSTVEIVCTFAMYRAAQRRAEFDPNADKQFPPFGRAYKLALQRCEEIRAGKRKLSSPLLTSATSGGAAISNNVSAAVPYMFNGDSTNPGTGGFNDGQF